MSAGAIRAGKAFVEISGENSGLLSVLGASKAKLLAFGASAVALGGILKDGLTAAVHHVGSAILGVDFAEAGSELNDMSERTGASVEGLSALKYAAQQTGADVGSLETGFKKMGQTLANAAEGSDQAKESLQKVGVSVSDLQGLSPEEQFAKIADGISQIGDPAKRTAAAIDIFGKSGTDLLPILNGGSEGLAAFRERAEALGLIMSTEDAQAADALGDAFDDLWATLKSVSNAIGSAFAPAVQSVVEILRMGAKLVADWVRVNSEMLQSTLEFVGGVRDALSAGDLALASRILWLGLKSVWLSGINALMEPWTRWKTDFQQTASDAFFGVLEVANNVWASLRASVAETTAFVMKAWAQAVNWTAHKLIDLQVKVGLLDKNLAPGAHEALDDMKKDNIQQAEKDRLDKRNQIEADRKKKEDELAQANIDANKAIADANEQQKKQIEEELARAKQELADALAKAREGAKHLPEPGKKGAAPGEAFEAVKSATVGSFSSFGLSGLGGGAPLKKVEDNTKETVDVLKKTYDFLKNGIKSLVFGK